MTPTDLPPPDDYQTPFLYPESETDFINVHDWFVNQNLLDKSLIDFEGSFIFDNADDCVFYTNHLTRKKILKGSFIIPTNVFNKILGVE